MARSLETDTLSNQNITTALEVGSYTAGATRLLFIRLLVDQAAGNGDYTAYATLQVNGSGSAYRLIPITTAAAASGITALGFVGVGIPVDSGDIVKVYVLGLAGDTTTPDTRVDFYENNYLAPTTADRTVGVDASGRVDVSLIEGSDATDQIRDAIVSDATRFAGSDVSAIKTKTDSLPFGVDFAAYFDAIPTATENAAGVLNATASSYNTSGTIGAKINSAASASGDGDISHTITIRDASSNPVDGAHVWVTTTLGGSPVASGYTNSAGQIAFMLDAGSYYQYVNASGHNFSNPTQVTVS